MTERERLIEMTNKFSSKFTFTEPRISVSDQVTTNIPAIEDGEHYVQIRDRATGEEIGISTEDSRKGQLLYAVNHTGEISSRAANVEDGAVAVQEVAKQILTKNVEMRIALLAAIENREMPSELKPAAQQPDEKSPRSPLQIEKVQQSEVLRDRK